MIIIGYQGIGKSTLAASNLKYIDLESSNFWFNDPETKQKIRHDNWYEMYCNVAEDLSRQGYFVFVSSHQPVRERLLKSGEYVIACVPSLGLKEQWIEKLHMRYETSGLEKDYKAYINAVDRFTENITEIANSGFELLEIKDMSYDLKKLIEDKVTNVLSEYGYLYKYTREELKEKIDMLKDWDNYEPFHKAVELIESMVDQTV